MSPTKKKSGKKSTKKKKKKVTRPAGRKKASKAKKAVSGAKKTKRASRKKTTTKKKASKKTSRSRTRKASPPSTKEPSIPKQMQKDVYSAYEKAVDLVHKAKISQAQKQFTKILSDYPGETEVLARVRTFLKVCEKKLDKKEARPSRSSEVLFSQGVLHHNAGEFDRAMESYSRALELSGKEKDHIHYAMAASQLSMGDTDAALRDLKKAIAGNPDNRFYAQNDPDFRELNTHNKFQALVGPE